MLHTLSSMFFFGHLCDHIQSFTKVSIVFFKHKVILLSTDQKWLIVLFTASLMLFPSPLYDHTSSFKLEKMSVTYFKYKAISSSTEQKWLMVMLRSVNLSMTFIFNINGQLSVYHTWRRLEHHYCFI